MNRAAFGMAKGIRGSMPTVVQINPNVWVARGALYFPNSLRVLYNYFSGKHISEAYNHPFFIDKEYEPSQPSPQFQLTEELQSLMLVMKGMITMRDDGTHLDNTMMILKNPANPKEFVLYNPVDVNVATMSHVQKIVDEAGGVVVALVVPTRQTWQSIDFWMEHFPQAEVWGSGNIPDRLTVEGRLRAQKVKEEWEKSPAGIAWQKKQEERQKAEARSRPLSRPFTKPQRSQKTSMANNAPRAPAWNYTSGSTMADEHTAKPRTTSNMPIGISLSRDPAPPGFDWNSIGRPDRFDNESFAGPGADGAGDMGPPGAGGGGGGVVRDNPFERRFGGGGGGGAGGMAGMMQGLGGGGGDMSCGPSGCGPMGGRMGGMGRSGMGGPGSMDRSVAEQVAHSGGEGGDMGMGMGGGGMEGTSLGGEKSDDSVSHRATATAATLAVQAEMDVRADVDASSTAGHIASHESLVELDEKLGRTKPKKKKKDADGNPIVEDTTAASEPQYPTSPVAPPPNPNDTAELAPGVSLLHPDGQPIFPDAREDAFVLHRIAGDLGTNEYVLLQPDTGLLGCTDLYHGPYTDFDPMNTWLCRVWFKLQREGNYKSATILPAYRRIHLKQCGGLEAVKDDVDALTRSMEIKTMLYAHGSPPMVADCAKNLREMYKLPPLETVE